MPERVGGSLRRTSTSFGSSERMPGAESWSWRPAIGWRMASRSSGPRGWPVHRCRRGGDLVLSLPRGRRPRPVSRLPARWKPRRGRRRGSPAPGTESGAQHVGSCCSALRIRGRSGGVGFEDGLGAHPTLVLVGLGFGRRERLMSQARVPGGVVRRRRDLAQLPDGARRAPTRLQRLGLEWLHRLLHEPRRLLRRYVVRGFPFSFMLFGCQAHSLWGN